MSPDKFVKTNRVCPICSCNEAENLCDIRFSKDKYENIPEHYAIVACNCCGFIFNDTNWTQKDYDAYYESSIKYSDKITAGAGGISYLDLERYNSQINRISDFINKDGFILDIGCAKGGLLLTMKKKGYVNLYGVDPLYISLDFLRDKNIKLIAGNLFDIDKLDITFDVIILSQVAEHIYDLKKLVYIIYKKLNKDGILYVDVPHSSDYIDYFFKPYHYFDIEHINHFSKNTLKYCFSDFNLLDMDIDSTYVTKKKKYPIIYGVFKKCHNNSSLCIKDRESIDRVKAYISKSDKENVYSIEHIDKSIPYFIWGFGAYSRRLLLDNKYFTDLNILGIIDKNKSFSGKKIVMHDKREIMVYDISYLQNISGYSIIITSVLYEEEIKYNLLKDKKFCGNIYII